MYWAFAMRRLPASVGAVEWVVRSRSWMPSASSSDLMRWLIADGVLYRTAAAAEKLPCSTTVTNVNTASMSRCCLG